MESKTPWIAAGVAGVFALLFAILFFVRGSALDTASADLENLQARVDTLTSENDELRKKVESLGESTAELSAEKALAEQAMEAMKRTTEELKKTQDELREKLSKEVEKGNVLIKDVEGDLALDLIDKVVFDSGEAELNDSGKEVLRQVADVLKKIEGKAIMVSGHTDNLGISKKLIEQYPTNWELSSRRATNVVRFLHEEMRIKGRRLLSVGHGEFRPVANNGTAKGRRKNRRIEVRLIELPKD